MSHIRVRFAPSPTGFMHLGNVRAALMNFLFAHQKQGTFILRIEDTDQQRNIDPEGKQIMEDLRWLSLHYQEGPQVGGSYTPYYQSQRAAIYQRYLTQCQERNIVYRCFCSAEELEKKRQRQLALKQPPRYDRACLHLSPEKIQENLTNNVPFIWRFKLDYDKSISFYDLAHKTMHFDLKHFSDVPLTRQDGTFTFMFANFIDDLEMKITHVFRGEDHLTNTAVQVAMYETFQVEVPVFWHLPIIGNAEGKKLSKRDFGFSLTDLRTAGFLPEALTNYLGIIGRSVEKEIMDLETLADTFDFEHMSSTGQIRYDIEKLRWVNHQWIKQYDTARLVTLCRPYLEKAHAEFARMPDEKLIALFAHIQPEIATLEESVEALAFVVKRPTVDKELLASHNFEQYKSFIEQALHASQLLSAAPIDIPQSVQTLQQMCKEQNIGLKPIFSILRTALTGKAHGLGLKDILEMLPKEEFQERFKQVLAV